LAKRQASGSLYLPLRLSRSGRLFAGLRGSGDYVEFTRGSETRYSADLFLRVLGFNLRANYRNNLTVQEGVFGFGQGSLTTSASYSAPSSARIPAALRGLSVRASVQGNTATRQVRQMDAQLSRRVGRGGRLNIGGSHQFASGATSIRAGLNIEIGARGSGAGRSASQRQGLMRSSTDYRSGSGDHSVRQTLRGSVGFDDNFTQFHLSDRQQVGRAGAAVVLFVDNNNSGTFDEGDELIPYPAVRVDRSSQMSVGRDGVVRLHQLQSYYRMNLEVNRQQIPNPTLVPAIDNFSFVTDPNQYKRIEIPFYRSGTIDGTVYRADVQGNLSGLGGLRVFLKNTETEYVQQIRTFFGGSFFAMDIPPGNYTLEVDPTQLEFMGVTPRDGVTQLQIQALPDGDFIGDIQIVLENPEEAAEAEHILVMEDAEQQFQTEFRNRAAEAVRAYVAAQMFTYEGNLVQAMRMVNRSLELIETDYALALKGTIYLLGGNEPEAERYWNRAVRRNPSIPIPNREVIETLYRIIELSIPEE
jgi:hypothetical protein